MRSANWAAGARLVSLVLVFFAGALPFAASAAPLARPTGPVILTVTGAISETNAPGRAEFDQAMLEALGKDEITTATEWTPGPTRFAGVRLSRVLDAVGAGGTTMLARALNDYSGEIPIEVARDYPVLLAMQIDGAPLAADKAPLWIIYPLDDYPALKNRTGLLWAWQLATIDVR